MEINKYLFYIESRGDFTRKKISHLIGENNEGTNRLYKKI